MCAWVVLLTLAGVKYDNFRQLAFGGYDAEEVLSNGIIYNTSKTVDMGVFRSSDDWDTWRRVFVAKFEWYGERCDFTKIGNILLLRGLFAFRCTGRQKSLTQRP